MKPHVRDVFKTKESFLSSFVSPNVGNEERPSIVEDNVCQSSCSFSIPDVPHLYINKFIPQVIYKSNRKTYKITRCNVP